MTDIDIRIRTALLDDTAAISQLFRSQIPVWQRLNARGQVENLPSDRLTIYERWSHGSASSAAWMSIETAALHLSRLLRGAGMMLVAEQNGRVVGCAEVYPGDEPAPFGQHLHLANLVIDPDCPAVFDALLRHLIDLARSMDNGNGQLTVSLAGSDPSQTPYTAYHLQPLVSVQRYHLAARTGQGFYKVNDHPAMPPVEDWHMSVGRSESSRQHLELLWNRIWEIIPEITARPIHRLQLNASGHEAYLCCQTQLYNPRSIDVYLWSPRALTPPLLTAIRDWSHRQNYRTLTLVINPETAKLIGAEAEADPYQRTIFSIQV